MKKYIWLFVVIGMVLSASGNANAWEISYDNYVAGAVYEESDSSLGIDINSNWSSFYYKGTLVASKYDNKEVQAEIFYGMPITTKSTETWDIDSSEYQTNDMNFWGIDTGFALGWALPVGLPEKTSLYVTPLIGYRWKFFRYTRDNFVVLHTITIAETVDEDVSVHSLDLGARINYRINDNFDLFAKPIFGIVVANSAHSSQVTINGERGFLFNLDTGLNYLVTKNLIIGGAFRMELQYLNGGEGQSYIWPDNTLSSYGGTINVTYKF